MNEEVILTFENWPMFQVQVYYQNDFTVVIVSFENQGFHISTTLGELSENEDGCGGRDKGREGRREGGVWHQNRTWFSEGRKGLGLGLYMMLD